MIKKLKTFISSEKQISSEDQIEGGTFSQVGEHNVTTKEDADKVIGKRCYGCGVSFHLMKSQ